MPGVLPLLQTYSVKSGLGHYVNLTGDSISRLFGNIMGVTGYSTRLSSTDLRFAGTDASLGYQYIFNTDLTFDVRYRFLANYIWGQTPNVIAINHGPLAGLTYKF